MYYLSTDIETTGLDTDRCQMLEFAAVAWTSDDPYAQYFRVALKHDRINEYAEEFAMQMNADLLAEIDRGGPDVIPATQFYDTFSAWLLRLY